MKLNNIYLKKEDRFIELIGMAHVAKPEFYASVQSRMNKNGNNTIVFYEGIKDNEFQPLNEEQKKIKTLFDNIFEFMPSMAKLMGIGFQKDHIKYPVNAVNADISFRELVLKLNVVNFNPNSLNKLFEKIKTDESLKQLLSKKLKEKVEGKEKPLGFLSKIFIKLFMGKFLKVILDYRNKRAVEIILSTIDKASEIGTFMVIYGDAHIKGIAKLLKKQGWK